MRLPYVRIDGNPTREELGWEPKPMVRWLSPRGLMTTGGQVMLSGIFGAYADKREIQAALKPPTGFDVSDEAAMWFDFMADTGDGFRPTYAVARALGEQRLPIAHGTGSIDTERGRILLLGGDIAYPAADPDEFRNRFQGPFEAALPDVPPGTRRPQVLSIAGNHDWLDGLTTFLRVFTNGQRIGAWQTVQTRSYFIAKLPHDWYLFCPDLGLDYFIDAPQMEYFHEAVDDGVPRGSKVILAIHRPYWLVKPLHAEPQLYSTTSMTNLERFEREVIHDKGLHLPLVLAGDIHHYNRYERHDGAQQRIVSGSGAAFIYPTHNLPATITWPGNHGVDAYERRRVFPSRKDSLRRRWGILLAPYKNPSFIAFVGVIAVLFAIAIRYTVSPADDIRFQSLIDDLRLARLFQFSFNSPFTVLVIAAVAAGLISFADATTWPRRIVVGSIHAFAHLTLILSLIYVVARVMPTFRPLFFAATYGPVLFLLGGWLGAQLFAIYLFLMQSIGHKHPTHAYSSQRIEDFRSFLRMRFHEDGSITIYPVGIRRVPRRWRYVRQRGAADPWFEPTDHPVQCRLIEDPIRIGADGRSVSAPAEVPAEQAGDGVPAQREGTL